MRLFHHATPETDTSCHYFWSVASRNTPFESESGKGFYTDVANAFLEDKAIIEAQQAIVSKQPDRPLLLRQHDKAVALGRRALHRLQQRDMLTAAE